MDPFTEKLLERTRARRENLQKKMAERPNAANRQMVKRPREPLADTNSVLSESVIDKVPQVSSKPSPSKRSRSGENVQPLAGEENQEPMSTAAITPVIHTDKKPPVGPASIRSASSLEKTAARPAVQAQSGQLKPAQSEPEQRVVVPAPEPPSSREPEKLPATPAPQRNKEELVEEPAPSATGMRSRLQRLAQQRQYWDGTEACDEAPDCAPMLKVQAEVLPAVVPTTSSGAAVGRRGRLANLAATIGSWEDDLSHANIPKENPMETPAAAVSKVFAVRDAALAAGTKPSVTGHVVAASSASNKITFSSKQDVCSPVKAGQVVLPSPQKVDVPAARPGLKSITTPTKSLNPEPLLPSSPLKSSMQGAVLPSSPQRALTSVPLSPVKNQAISRGLNPTAGPHKPELRAKPTVTGASGPQEKAIAGGPGVKSFLERFGEKCQERSNQGSPAGGATHTKTPTVTPSVTPNTRLVQERLRAAHAANTATADLTQRQKLERESELAQIRNRFQKGNNMWKNKDEGAESNKSKDIKEALHKPVESEVAPCETQDGPTAPPTESTETPRKCTPPAGQWSAVSPPASTSCPVRAVTETSTTDEEEEDLVTEKEMNVDQSINSAVITDIFDGILEQSEDQSDEEEEDPLNISSMSLLTPLAETVAAVVQSPDRRMMTSTPASSFLVKSNTPDHGSKPSKFQRTNMTRFSTDSLEPSDEGPRMPYSIDAYRSIRVKETERPNLKQVIVRKEDVSLRGAEEPRGATAFSVKQKIKVLTNDLSLQQTVIHQASQALNCCTDEEHGKGSEVEAEAERLLLVATERREALKTELERLKGDPSGQRKAHAAPDTPSTSASKGSITLQEVRLPLKADFVCSTANKPESTKHSFFIMLRAGVEHTVATPLASTHRGLSGDTLAFPTKFTISDVSSNFEVDIEVYGLVQKREVCIDKKKKLNKSKAITPKRFLAITKSSHTPVMASPGGPNAVRTSNFVLVGSHKLNLSSIGKHKFPLEKVPFLCPLEGHIYLKMQCEVGSSKVEEKGFLTMFEDVSGFGSWHRRWCVLSGYQISYWTYPDDEKRKNPMGRINLANCTSQKVEPANREFCARPHTFELITVRPQREDDKETLVSQCQNTMCVTKNWLCADTKDERNLWMKKLNQILVDLRMWQPDACFRPL